MQKIEIHRVIIVPLEGLFAKEITALQRPNVLLLDAVRILDGHFHLPRQIQQQKSNRIQERNQGNWLFSLESRVILHYTTAQSEAACVYTFYQYGDE